MEKVKIKVECSKDLPKVETGYTRTFFVIRLHDGKAEVIAKDLVAKDGIVTFETDKFSTYAIAYEDTLEEAKDTPKEEAKEEIKEDAKENASNPKTGDQIIFAVIVLIVAVIGTVFTLKVKMAKK